jgi:hypothetical protein
MYEDMLDAELEEDEAIEDYYFSSAAGGQGCPRGVVRELPLADGSGSGCCGHFMAIST